MSYIMKWQDVIPYEPRPLQPEFMNDMIASLETNPAVILDASNGFGKTLCALCAAKELGFDRIYYSTRTHKQAKTVIKALRKINEHAGEEIMTGIELSGRERSCLAQDIAPRGGLDARALCSRYRSDAVCKIGKDEWDWIRVTVPGRPVGVDLPGVLDSEDLKKIALTNNMCPYYLSTAVQSRFEVVVCSYNHVFDRVVRDALNLKIKNSLIVCDEAHNVISAIESFLTREMSSEVLADAKRRCGRLSSDTMVVFGKLESLLVKIGYYFERRAGSKKAVKVDDINGFLDEVGIKGNWLRWALRCLKNDDNGTGSLGDISTFISTLMNEGEKSAYFHVKKKGGGKKERTLRVTSLDAKPVIQEIFDSGAKIAFISGTISPSWFVTRLGLEHVPVHEYKLPKRNLEVYITDHVPGKRTKLTSYFNARDNEDNLVGFATHVATILPEIPGGSIAFFPSYDFRDKVINMWGSKGYIDYNDDLVMCFMANGQEIPVFIENKNDKDKKTISDYKEQTKTGKALLLAVFRGGASEGEDFPNDQCRGVFCIGFPLMNTMSSDVQFKVDHYNRINSGSGAFWVKWDAMLSVSQAIGRGIRDPVNDKAVAILLGTRYTKLSNVNYLSGWIRESIVERSEWLKPEEIAKKVKKFFSRP